MADANQVWDVPQAIDWLRHLAALPPALDRGADQPRRRARPRRHPPRRRAAGRRHRRALRQQGAVQAAAAGRRHRLLPGRRLPPRRPQRGAGGAAAGGPLRRAGLPARRRHRPVRVRAAHLGDRLRCASARRSTIAPPSSPTTCTSTSSIRCASAPAATCVPEAPGYSAEMRPESLAALVVPGRQRVAPCLIRARACASGARRSP